MAVPGRYSVTYLVVEGERVAVVDLGSVADVSLVALALRWLGLRAANVTCIVATHLHFDHVMGIDSLASRINVPVVLGPVAYDHVTRGARLRFPGPQRSWRALLTWPMQGLPFLCADDWRHGLGFGFPWSRNGFKANTVRVGHHGLLPGFSQWRVLEAPGHSDEGVCLYHAGARLLIAGDSVRNFYGGEWSPLLVDTEAFERTRVMLSSLTVDTVFPGHGPVLRGNQILDRLMKLPVFAP